MAMLGRVLGSVLMGMLTSLLTERVLRAVIILCLEKLVAKTKTDLDDKLLAEAKKSWEEADAAK